MKKKCTKCGEEKDLESFHKERTNKSGYRSDCKQCVSRKNKKRYATNESLRDKQRERCRANREYYRIKSKEFRKKNKDYFIEYNKRNREHINTLSREWRANNREAASAACKRWRSKNGAVVAAACIRRQKRLKNSAPDWLTSEQLDYMNYMYSLARELTSLNGEPYHVDHIMPLRGENICGLHVPWNLQILPSDLNIKKGNKYESSQVCT